MLRKTVLICAGLIALSLIAATCTFAQVVVTQPTTRIGHIGVQPYMRIPVGARAEAAPLKADQDAAKLALVPKKKSKGR